jgi:hypothetical protein
MAQAFIKLSYRVFFYPSYSRYPAAANFTLTAIMVAVSAHLQLAFKWIGLLNTLDYAGMTSVMSDNFLSRERPTSMGFPPRNKQQYIEALSGVPMKYFNVSLVTPEAYFNSYNLLLRFPYPLLKTSWKT